MLDSLQTKHRHQQKNNRDSIIFLLSIFRGYELSAAINSFTCKLKSQNTTVMKYFVSNMTI